MRICIYACECVYVSTCGSLRFGTFMTLQPQTRQTNEFCTQRASRADVRQVRGCPEIGAAGVAAEAELQVVCGLQVWHRTMRRLLSSLLIMLRPSMLPINLKTPSHPKQRSTCEHHARAAQRCRMLLTTLHVKLGWLPPDCSKGCVEEYQLSMQ